MEKTRTSKLKIAGVAKLPTKLGEFLIVSFDLDSTPLDDVAIIKGDIQNRAGVLLRIQSECLTSEVFGSLRCDCKEQLEKGLELINKEGAGIVIYLRQAGRGIGIRNKVKAYQLQDTGLDTVEANQALSVPIDGRSYLLAINILRLFKVKSVKILTNNPDKIAQLRRSRLKIEEIIPMVPTSNPYNQGYLITKRKKLGQNI